VRTQTFAASARAETLRRDHPLDQASLEERRRQRDTPAPHPAMDWTEDEARTSSEERETTRQVAQDEMEAEGRVSRAYSEVRARTTQRQPRTAEYLALMERYAPDLLSPPSPTPPEEASDEAPPEGLLSPQPRSRSPRREP